MKDEGFWNCLFEQLWIGVFWVIGLVLKWCFSGSSLFGILLPLSRLLCLGLEYIVLLDSLNTLCDADNCVT